MKKIIIILAIILTGNISAQSFNGKQFASDLFLMDEYIKRQSKGISFADTDTYTGTPYNNASFLPGSIYKDGKLLAENVALRYNAIADEMEVKEKLTSPDDDAKVLTKSPDIFVKIVSTIFVFVPYQGGIEEGGYFEVIYEGSQVDFYKKIIKDFDEEKKATSSLTRDIPASFSDEPEYFLVTKVGKFYQFPNSRNKKLKVFGDKEKQVKKYVKEKRLDLNKEKDLLKAIKYFETI
ncbi:hypothetical protein ULMS_00070 [Patiriisocius marinistellae]|uniref:Uncharacterized protein n=1 Tax=Patiriisocius marinistellae TaxID=2494560 RepID=A0A5J4FWT2_9FLAO|nr:hypothetical protein [Patiriisocius marinistellae]GEQ84499.1 hypothetical protein ULMS_00070 [Patiriisocius marinistellae]